MNKDGLINKHCTQESSVDSLYVDLSLDFIGLKKVEKLEFFQLFQLAFSYYFKGKTMVEKVENFQLFQPFFNLIWFHYIFS